MPPRQRVLRGRRIALSSTVSADALASLKNAVAAAKPGRGAAGAALETIQQGIATFQPFAVEIRLHGLYAGHHFDGFLNGGTGEFYWIALTTNGNDVYDITSINFGNQGVLEKVSPGEWIDFGSYLIWPDATGQNGPAPTEAVTMSFTLLERDDDAVAKKVLAGLSKAAEAILESQGAAGQPGVAKGHEAILELAQLLIGVYAVHDHAIDKILALNGPADHYKVGRFVRLTGEQNTYAILSVLPDRTPDTADWGEVEVTGIASNYGNPAKPAVELSTAANNQQRLVSMFVRPHFSLPGSGVPGTKVTVSNTGDSFTTTKPTIRSFIAAAGDDLIEAQVESVFRST